MGVKWKEDEALGEGGGGTPPVAASAE